MRKFDNAVFLINPNRFPGYSRKLKKILNIYGTSHVVECDKPEEFRKEVEAFAAGSKQFLLIWGGDGTANFAINAYMSASGRTLTKTKALGFLRGGSGNGIQDSYEVPVTIRAQVRSYLEGMEQGFIQPVDLIRVDDGRTSVYCQLLGIGLDAKVLEYREGAGGGRPGILNYIFASLRSWYKDFYPLRGLKKLQMEEGKYAFKGPRSNAEFPFDSFTRETRSPLIEIATRPYYAKMFKIAPDVVCNSGFMDIYSFNFLYRRELLFNIFDIWNGWHRRINRHQAKRGRPVIERYEVKRVAFSMSKPFSYHVDGELRYCDTADADGQCTLKCTIVPSAVNFLVPDSFYRKFHPF
ncbi:diacylglycerol kinase family protein [Marispirochaeta sp.]|uniref:diacylglycerol/lipid kinase family protein n=1 Tax=Marispirochaeta sp. TaxID=2038653 RepID=UPI0029C6C543|nr:diacylglycerol kinase family protein [Marispirochaeta sp.]